MDLLFFKAIASPKRMAEKEGTKSKKYQNTQKQLRTRNIYRSSIEHVDLKAPNIMNDKKISISICNLTELYMFFQSR